MSNQVEIPVAVMNHRIIEGFVAGNVEKTASASTQVTRTQLREESFAFKILPPELATDDMLVPSLIHDKPQIFWELEADSPGAKWVPFQTVPEGEYIYGSRYVIPMARVLTPKFEKDIDELRVYKQDLRKVLTENAIKDGLAEIDGKFIEIINGIVLDLVAKKVSDGTYVDTTYAAWVADRKLTTPTLTADIPIQKFTGKVQYKKFAGGITQDNLAEAKKLLPAGSKYPGMEEKFRLRTFIALMNDSTAQDLQKFQYNEVGDVATDMFKNGLVMDKIMGMKVLYTIKGSLVPDGTVYLFAAPEFLGKCFYMTDWTMYMKKEAYMIEMFAYWMGGMAIGNVAGVVRADF